MLNKTPKTVVFPTAAQHSFDQGGQAMDIKHTHPQYPDEEQRLLREKGGEKHRFVPAPAVEPQGFRDKRTHWWSSFRTAPGPPNENAASPKD